MCLVRRVKAEVESLIGNLESKPYKWAHSPDYGKQFMRILFGLHISHPPLADIGGILKSAAGRWSQFGQR